MAATVAKSTIQEAEFIRRAHDIVRDHKPVRPVIIRTDLQQSNGMAYVELYIYHTEPAYSPLMILSFFVASFLLYRASVFTHELAHIGPTRFRAFRIVWNLLFGIPFLMPSYFYTDHRVHHVNQLYGTAGDAEYFPYAHMRPWSLALNVLIVFLIPFMLVLRFSVLTVACLFSPRLKTWVWQKASSLGNLNPRYFRAPADAHERWCYRWQETGCFLVVAAVATLTILGVIPMSWLVRIYAAYVFVTFVNQLRVYAAHRYINESEPMSFLEQMLDSTTIPGGPWSELWAPLGMRYHALHHLFPAMPYHAMGAAHRRLMRELPADSPYHATLRPSLAAAIADLIRSAREHHARRAAPAA